jgi:hypothetical protein
MKRIIQLALLTGCILGMAMGQSAHAAQFNVTVPINLSKMPSNVTHIIVKGFLICGRKPNNSELGNAIPEWNDQPGLKVAGRKIVGVGQKITPINTSTGEFHSSITLGLNVAQGYYPNNVGSYSYRFRLQGNGQVIDFNQVIFSGIEVHAPLELVQYSGGEFDNPALVGQKCDRLDFTE